MEKLLTMKEVAEKYKVNPATIKKWIQNKELVAVKLGRQYRFHPKDLKIFEEERKIK